MIIIIIIVIVIIRIIVIMIIIEIIIATNDVLSLVRSFTLWSLQKHHSQRPPRPIRTPPRALHSGLGITGDYARSHASSILDSR